MNATICVVIPTYQEVDNIGPLISQLKTISRERKLELGVIVIDDNSPDGTAAVVQEFSGNDENVILIQRQEKSGLGSATSTGIKKALSFPSCQAIITMDSDFSHDPKDIPRLITEGAELVVGSRYVTGGKIEGWSIYRNMISLVANTTCRFFLRTGVHDNTANFRYYSRRCAEACLDARGHDFEWIISVLLKAKKQGFKAHEVPVKFVNRKQGKSKLQPGHILRWSRFLFRSLLTS
jgi:dolichol-phosphate mannosyltransferase